MKALLLISTLLMTCALKAQTPNSKKKLIYNYLTQDFYRVGLSYGTWQEQMSGVSEGKTGQGLIRFSSYKLNVDYYKPTKNVRTLYNIGAYYAFVLGSGKITGDTADDFESQKWGILGFTPGVTYKTSLLTEFGLQVPLGYRFSFFTSDPSLPPLDLEGDDGFFIGLSAVVTTKITAKSQLVVQLTHQVIWEATQWTVGWQYEIR